MRPTVVLLVLGAVLLSITSATASIQADNEKDAAVPSGEGVKFLRGLETTDSEERAWSIKGLFGRGKFEKLLINDPAQLNKYKTDTIISKLKGTKFKAHLVDYLNWRSEALRAGIL